ncbi:hypothetical protein AWB67_07126 [Caballeronia terrestris]|uniref:Uncharacterized protein n=1 Tax=Caballeronia terrestris TaxID=1226301 RepID=A0A158KYU1_9BURK|nr:hypothetical protein AWB67_07126 [Caballeronia terrestris]
MNARDLQHVGKLSWALDVDADFAVAGNSDKCDVVAVAEIEMNSISGIDLRLAEWTVTHDDIAGSQACLHRQDFPQRHARREVAPRVHLINEALRFREFGACQLIQFSRRGSLLQRSFPHLRAPFHARRKARNE